jgi:hypothetical protein
MAGRRTYNGARFKELVLHISQASLKAGDEGFGMVKLNKLLYRADFEAFRLLGRSITGATYERQDYGPVARELPLALDDLARTGYLVWRHVPTGPYTRDVPEAVEQPDLRLFTPEELAIVSSALEELGPYGGRGASEWSHEESAGWRVEKNGEELSYSSGLIDVKPLDPEALNALRDRVLKLSQ